MPITYEAMAGEHVTETARRIVEIARLARDTVTADFNGVSLSAGPHDEADAIAKAYSDETERRAAAYRETEEYKRREREAAEIRARHAAAADEPLPPFTLKNGDLWYSWKANNDDAYGAASFRFAQRWAGLMEREMAAGARLPDIAERTSHEADTEGISGFVASCAGSILAHCWVHGDELKRWHEATK